MSRYGGRRIEGWLLLGAVLAAPSACTLLVSTADLSSPTAGAGPQTEAGLHDVTSDAGTIPDAASCRALRDLGVTVSGTYPLRRDGGAVDVYCEMESFDGGWTLVTKDMIASEVAVQDIAPDSPARVDAARTTDANGGVGFSVVVTAVNCGAVAGKASPLHAFTLVDVEGWKEIMATYRFGGTASCWNLFGDTDAPDTNLRPFDLALDRFDRDVNMARANDGTAIRFNGTTRRCDENPENFWGESYAAAKRGIRTVQRRRTDVAPFGLGVGVDCGNAATWDIEEIYVR